MKFVNPMNDTPEGKLLAIVRDIEKAMGLEKDACKSMESAGMCKDDDCPTCGKGKVRN